MNKFKRTQHRANKKLVNSRWTYIPFRTSCNPRNNKHYWINLYKPYWSFLDNRPKGTRFIHHMAALRLTNHCRQSVLTGRYWQGGSRLKRGLYS